MNSKKEKEKEKNKHLYVQNVHLYSTVYSSRTSKIDSTLPNAFENINYESCLPSNLSPAILWQNNFPNFFLSNPALPETDFPNESRLLPDPFLYFLRAKSAEDFSRNTTRLPFYFENVRENGRFSIFHNKKVF